jgi:hypothetical protein
MTAFSWSGSGAEGSGPTCKREITEILGVLPGNMRDLEVS